jgi:outer membrane protein assembly factor BamD
MIHIAMFVAVNLLVPVTQPLETTQFPDRAEIAALTPHDLAADRHASRHLEIGRSYFGEREYFAALNRLKVVVTQFQASRHVEEALALLTEAYLALGDDSAAQTATAVLARKFPHGPWCAEARDSLRAAGLEPAEDETFWISRAVK